MFLCCSLRFVQIEGLYMKKMFAALISLLAVACCMGDNGKVLKKVRETIITMQRDRNTKKTIF